MTRRHGALLVLAMAAQRALAAQLAFAFVSYSGVGVMRPDGTDLVWVYTGTAMGSLFWVR